MRRTLGRGRRSEGRDFEQERADLQQGYQNLGDAYARGAEETWNDPTLTASEKRARLEAYRQALARADQEYREQLARLDREQRESLEWEGFETAEPDPGQARFDYEGDAGDAAAPGTAPARSFDYEGDAAGAEGSGDPEGRRPERDRGME